MRLYYEKRGLLHCLKNLRVRFRLTNTSHKFLNYLEAAGKSLDRQASLRRRLRLEYG